MEHLLKCLPCMHEEMKSCARGDIEASTCNPSAQWVEKGGFLGLIGQPTQPMW